MIDAADAILVAIAVAAGSGLPGLRWRHHGPALAALLLGLAGIAALVAAGLALASPAVAWQPGALGRWTPQVDGLAAVFIAATGVVAAMAGLYGAGYWRDAERPQAPVTRLLLGLAVAGILAVEVAADTVVFLTAWEVMTVGAFALVATLHREAGVRGAAWLYLACTRIGTLALICGFVLVAGAVGGTAFTALPPGFAASGAGSAVFILLLIAFGLKAGMVPFHIWLPPAHASAPGHVSALMSGVLIKTGIYGLCRLLSLVPDPPAWWGGLILVSGVASCLLGVLWALGSHDLKRLLAYHSIENIGIILLGIGLAVLGRALDHPLWIALGLGGALLHVVNHALFKSLLFLGAGAVDHACGTRAIDRLGGLARRMPVTACCFLVGAAAISGLPPLNGFVSEWLVYLGLLDAGGPGGGGWAAAALAALALTGGLALACFAKAGGAVFLGEPRTPAAARAHEAGLPERSAMAILAGCCLAIGLGLPLLAPLLDAAIAAAAPGAAIPALAGHVGAAPLVAVTVALIAAGGLLWWRLSRRVAGARRGTTWDCGYAEPDARMQYTAASFAEPLTSTVRPLLQSARHAPTLRPAEGPPATLAALFPANARFADHPRDPVLDRVVAPVASGLAWVAGRLRIAHRGHVHVYLLYVAVTLVALLAWSLR